MALALNNGQPGGVLDPVFSVRISRSLLSDELANLHHFKQLPTSIKERSFITFALKMASINTKDLRAGASQQTKVRQMIRTNTASQVLSPAPDDYAESKSQAPSASNPPAISIAPEQAPPLKTLRRLLADQQDLYDLADALRQTVSPADDKPRASGDNTPLPPADISKGLNDTILVPFVGSSFALTRKTPPSLATAITDLGFELPRTADEVTALAKALDEHACVHPLGNFGGGLSWPIPMSQQDQTSLFSFLYVEKDNALAGLPLPVNGKGTLAYLLSGSSVTQADLKDPIKALQKMLDSPNAKALGQALQTRLNGVSTDTSIYDYLLTAIHLGLDTESIRAPERNKIAGVDITQSVLWGRAPSTVVERLSQHLIAKGRATSDTAKLAVHLLLARTAPQFLIKDIPESVKTGSQAWVNLTIAAAAIEAQQPGVTTHMTYAQVLAYPRSAQGSSPVIENAKNNAVVDWAIANGTLTKDPGNRYTPAQINTAISEFNTQQNDRLAASEALELEIPSRKELALNVLRARFKEEIASAKLKTPPENFEELFENPILTSEAPRGKYEWGVVFNMNTPVDIVMMDWVNRRRLKSIDPRFPVETLNSSTSFGIRGTFDSQALNVIRKKEEAIKTVVRHLISQLPLEDRKNFEYGKIQFFQEGTEHVGMKGGHYDFKPEPPLLVKTERAGKIAVYEVNYTENSIKLVASHRAATKHDWNGKDRIVNIKATLEFKPKTMNVDNDDITIERTPSEKTPDSFNSSRSSKIGHAFVEHLHFDEEVLKEEARGQTPEDTISHRGKIAKNIVLDLIPFRSAIVNFAEGNIGAGLFDLALDAFSFLTAGAGAAGKLMKIGKSALSAGTKALRAVRVIGATTLAVFNPLDGAGDLVRGMAHKALATGQKGIKALGNILPNAELLKVIKSPDIVQGTFKTAQDASEVTTLAKFDITTQKWYAYNPQRKQVYGKALDGFKAEGSAVESTRAAGKADDSLLNAGLSRDNVVRMGGPMENLTFIGSEMHTFVDTYKGTKRLNIVAHGVAPAAENKHLFYGTQAVVDGVSYDAGGLLALLKSKKVIPEHYDNVRLLVCHGADGIATSFAHEFQTLIQKPVKSFEGEVFTNYGATPVTADRNNEMTKIMSQYPWFTPAQVELLANMRLRRDALTLPPFSVEKDHGKRIIIDTTKPGEAATSEAVAVNYRPRHFS